MDGNGVNDDELNQMIAGLQGAKAAPPVVTSNSGAPITPPVTSMGDGTAPAFGTSNDTGVSSGIVNNTTPTLAVTESTATTPATYPIATGVPVNTPNAELASIKQNALTELRPLVDKLNLPPEEKFDTLLLIIRSTDDSSLVPAAHVAAQQIADDTRRAQALLDIIKEIDFFGQNSAK